MLDQFENSTRVRAGTLAGAFAVLCLCWQLTACQQVAAQVDTATPPPSTGLTMSSATPWTAAGTDYGNAREYVVTARALGKQQIAAADVLGRMLVTTEPRTSHDDALQRLADIATSRDGAVRILEIGGWPAIELQFTEALPRRGITADGSDPPKVQRSITAVAVGDKVVSFDVSASPDAPPEVIDSSRTFVTAAAFATRGEPEAVKRALGTLESEVARRRSLRAPPEKPSTPSPSRPSASPAVATGDAATAIGAGTQNAGNVRVQNGVGELEIAASANAMNIVIASNAALSFSTNRGATYAAGAAGTFGLNDPSLARAVSGNFYLDVIAFPNGSAAHLNVNGCTNAVSRSTNNGANFGLQGYSARCPLNGAGLCFPDQEHIAADAFNAAGGNDQLYAVWRNFTPAGTPPAACTGIGGGFVTASITCSQNNGTTWTATAAIPGAGDFPRVAVGRDGSVFVTTLSGNNVLLNRFTSCANGLTAEAGFPVTVATISGAVNCPVAGLDRCNDGNSLTSATPAPDPQDANHLFVSFAERDGAGGERIITRESNNRGASFPNVRTISAAQSARRFMPWACSTRGAAWTGWYDRRASGAANNDLTEYFLGSTLGHEWNLSGIPDPQCASGWQCAPRSTNDSESCSVQPQLAGVCRNAAGAGSGTRCDFSAGGCPAGENCMGGGGCPKYGDYNGLACAGNFVVAAWSSATSPSGVPAGAGLRVFSSTHFVARNGAAIWRHTGTPCTGDSCPGWQRLDNNHKTMAIASSGNLVYQLHNDGWIWQGTGTACTGDSCPGWIRLDNNSKTVAIAAAGNQLYQLHNDGWIFRYTGTPCSGNSCPGWQRLDNNSKTIAIAAAGSQLYQLHNDGWIWRFTGTACNGNSCPGWQRLDNNSKTVAIAAANELYQLHNDGMIWRFTGTACTGNSCPGWQRLDNNTKTVAITASGRQLYQLHNDGWIWRYTGTACTGNSCPGWQRLDNNHKAISFAASGDNLFQLHNDGWIWRFTGTACTGNSCPGWQRLDNNPRTGMIAAGDQLFQLHTDPLYQLHNDGALWRYTGEECDGDFCPGWQRLDNNPATRDIVATGVQLFQRHNTGRVWRFIGTPCSGNSCPGWQMLDNNPKTTNIVAGGNQLFQLHNDGWIWRYTGTPCNGNVCPGWQRLDNNPKTVNIAASGSQLFQLHNDGWIWRYTGTACTGNNCPGWQRLDNNPKTVGIAAAGTQLYQLHNDGWIWRYTGTPCNGDVCASWQRLDNNPKTVAITAYGGNLFQLHNDGWIWRHTGTPCVADNCSGWQRLDNNPKGRQILVGGTHLYQRHNDGWIWRYNAPPCTANNCPGWRRLDNNPRTRAIAAGGFQSN